MRTEEEQFRLVRPVVGGKVEYKCLDILEFGEVRGEFKVLVVALWQCPLLSARPASRWFSRSGWFLSEGAQRQRV
eukprot:COSAG06_NODE_60600_length_270_cov_0.801170_1_plen_74_part_01